MFILRIGVHNIQRLVVLIEFTGIEGKVWRSYLEAFSVFYTILLKVL